MKLDLGYERRVAVSKMSVSWMDSLYYIDRVGARKEASIRVEIKRDKFLLSFKLPDVSMYQVDFSLEKKDRKINLLGNYELAGTKYKESFRISNYNNFNYQFHFGKGYNLSFEINETFKK